jgi:hypothetical protein
MEIHSRELATLGSKDSSQHSNPRDVEAEVNHIVSRSVSNMMRRIGHVDCSSVFCKTNAEYQQFSAECKVCNLTLGRPGRCAAGPPAIVITNTDADRNPSPNRSGHNSQVNGHG